MMNRITNSGKAGGGSFPEKNTVHELYKVYPDSNFDMEKGTEIN
ncbi:hypothetical protein J14TS5_59080 [Paenibacillus lautus]|nr:hypothetical protein J14TS5_59080 [Paenibacillus lautus]